MATFSVNLSVDEWQQVKNCIDESVGILANKEKKYMEQDEISEDAKTFEELDKIKNKIDKHQRAKVNQENNITRKNKLIKLYEAEVKKLKERVCIMTATASTHIQDINDIHTDYRVKMEDLQKGNDILSKECKRRIDGLKNKDAPLQQFKQMENMIKQLTIAIVVCNVENDGGEEIKLVNPKSKKWNKGFNKQQEEIYETIVKKMNDTDWNDDDGYCKLIYDTKSKTLGFETMDSESEEEIIIVKKATGKVKTQK